MQKAYARIHWENDPSTNTPLNETNLNKVDSGLDTVDDRIILFDTTKANQTDLLQSVKNITYNSTTGTFVFTWWNGTTLTADLNIEKIPVSFSMSPQGIITMTTADGTVYTCDVASLIKTYTFTSGDVILFTTTTDSSGNKTVTATIADGSVTEEMLEVDFLANCRLAQANAEAAADSAEADALKSEGHAIGTQNGEPVGSTSPYYHNNSKWYKEQAEAAIGSGIATTEHVGLVKPDGDTIVIDEDGTIHGTETYVLPPATEETLGGVKPDGETIVVDEDGTIHGTETYVLPPATESSLGGIIAGDYVDIEEDGTVNLGSCAELNAVPFEDDSPQYFEASFVSVNKQGGILSDAQTEFDRVTQELDNKADSGYTDTSEYQAVTYLQSHAEEYINTHITANSKTRFEVVGSFVNPSPTEDEILGTSNISQMTTSRCAFGIASNIGWYFGTGSENNYFPSSPVDTNKHTFVVDILNKKIKLDNFEQSVSFSFDSGEHGEMLLFARNNWNGVNSYANFIMESAKIFANNILVFDGIPCYRKSDNVAGIYDKVTKTFFTNEGSGTFGVGEDSEVPIINIPTLKNVADSLDSPTIMALSAPNNIYMRAIRSEGVGLTIIVPLNKQPTNVIGADIQFYYDGTWHNCSVSAWAYIGNALVVNLSFEGTLPVGAYGVIGTLNITY